MSVEPRAIGEVVDYPSMMRILRDRANELQIARSHEDTSDLAGLPDKYLAKLLGPRPVRRIGMKTMGAVLGVLQIKFIAVVDDEAVRHYGNRVRKRDDRLVRANTVHIELSYRVMKKARLKGGQNSRKYMSQKRARQLGREAAHVRWDRVKAVARGEQ